MNTTRIYKFSRLIRLTALYTATSLMFQIVNPLGLMASATQPTQMEFMGGSGGGSSDMVDLTTGGFKYDIPLVDADEYNLTLKYNSNVGMESEASWVGLGWSLNTGAINREMRGLPDDFNGDEITEQIKMKNVETSSDRIGAEFSFNYFGSFVNGENQGDYTNNILGNGKEKEKYYGGGAPSIPFMGIPGLKTTNSGYMNYVFNTKLGNVVSKTRIHENGGVLKAQMYNISIEAGKSKTYSESDIFHSRRGSVGQHKSNSYNEWFSVGYQYYSYAFRNGVGGGVFKSSEVPVLFDAPQGDLNTSMGQSGFKFGDGRPQSSIIKASETDMALTANTANGKTYNTMAYGYEHQEDVQWDKLPPIFDYSRSHIQQHRFDHAKILSYPVSGKDRYHVSSPGFSGTIEAQSELWEFYGLRDQKHLIDGKNTTTSRSHSAEGRSYGVSLNEIKTGQLKDNSNFPIVLTQEHYANDYDKYLSYSFSDEDRIVDPTYYDGIGGYTNAVYHPCQINLGKNLLTVMPDLYDRNSNKYVYPTTRNQAHEIPKNVSILNNHGGANTSLYVDNNEVQSYTKIDGSYTGVKSGQTLDLDNSLTGKSPTRSFNLTGAQGEMYDFDHPIVNNIQRNVSFSVTSDKQLNGFTSYIGNNDNTLSNSKGRYNRLQTQEIPAYASAFLLSSIRYPNYIDRTGDGISDDDYGNYAKLNYTRLYDDFNWRIPFTTAENGTGFPQASLQEGLKSIDHDDMASYSYGQKEVWYPHSVETNNYIIEFTINNVDRTDVVSSAGENGGRDVSKKLARLDEIRLYSKEDRLKNNGNAIPIKTIIFNYNQSLCEGVYTSSDLTKGKLTLTSLTIKEGTSHKRSLSPFQFEYSTTNYDYDPNKIDMWGNYKKEYANFPSNRDFPFVYQNKADADLSAQAWKLVKITNPSGSEINIEYESDDYSHVQDQKAMAFQKIAGFSHDDDLANATDELYDLSNTDLFKNHLFVNLGSKTSGYSKNDFFTEYLMPQSSGTETGNKYFYIIAKVDLTGGLTPHEEFVKLYVRISDYGVTTSGNDTYGWIKMLHPMESDYAQQDYELNENYPGKYFYEPNPITQFSAQKLRSQFAEQLFNQMSIGISRVDEEQKLKLDNILLFDACRHVNLDHSFIRLHPANGVKYGGGARVKSITVNDNWNKMVTGTSGGSLDKSYGFTYSYEHADGSSTGVASYEPNMGMQDENPLKYPLWHKPEVVNYFFHYSTEDLGYWLERININANPKSGSDFSITTYNYMDMPVGHEYFPGAGITYEKVTVLPIGNSNVSRNSMGKSEYQFYTYKDYPVLFDYTPILEVLDEKDNIDKHSQDNLLNDMNNARLRNNAHFSRKNFEAKSQILRGISQGILFVTNDMNGKLRKVSSFDRNGTEISSSEFLYKDIEINGKNVLDNNIKTIAKDGTIENKLKGVTIDLLHDMNYQQNNLTTVQKSESFMILSHLGRGLGKLIDQNNKWNIGMVPTNRNKIEGNHLNINKSSSTFKLVELNGILDKTITHSNNIKSEAQVIAYDEKTSNAILTSSINNFGNPVYEFTIPAYWAYPKMAGAYQTRGLNYTAVTTSGSNNILNITDAEEYFVKGDQILVYSSGSQITTAYWVNKVNSNDIELITRLGDDAYLLTNTVYYLSTVKSGYANQLSASVGSIVTLENPIPATGNSISFDKILSASAVEYSDEWQIPCIDNQGEQVTYYLDCGDQSVLPVGYGSPFTDYPGISDLCSASSAGEVNNPYLTGMRGKFKPKKHYIYRQSRTQGGSPTSNVNGTLASDGVYSSFTEFWKYDNTSEIIEPIDAWNSGDFENWQLESEITLYDVNGHVIEQKGISGRHTAAIYGYNAVKDGNQLPIAQAIDAQYNEIAYDGFEGYNTRTSSGTCQTPAHFNFYDERYVNDYVSSTESHTGKFSLALCSGNYIGTSRKIESCKQSASRANETTLEACDCLPNFAPTAGKEYLVSAWVKKGQLSASSTYGETYSYTDYVGAEIVVLEYDNSQSLINTTVLEPNGNIIEGWQRIYESVTLNNATASVEIRLQASNDLNVVSYFDDFRFQPYTSEMTCNVYDLETMRLTATLDQENFATYYEYDRSGSLLSQKQETYRGVFTTAESRSATQTH